MDNLCSVVGVGYFQTNKARVCKSAKQGLSVIVFDPLSANFETLLPKEWDRSMPAKIVRYRR